MGSGNIFLVGMMGAGKTTLGQVARAAHSGCEFVDYGPRARRAHGVPVATIFEFEGEAGFRAPGVGACSRSSPARDGCVIATGGGVVLAEENRRLMRESGTVVYLRARLESLWERTRHDSSRPLLATADPRATLAALLEQRDPLYREAAHVIVDTGSQSAELAGDPRCSPRCASTRGRGGTGP